MSKPINLNQARKARDRNAAKTRADANARKFGRTKAQRVLDASETSQMRAALDAKRFEDE